MHLKKKLLNFLTSVVVNLFASSGLVLLLSFQYGHTMVPSVWLLLVFYLTLLTYGGTFDADKSVCGALQGIAVL